MSPFFKNFLRRRPEAGRAAQTVERLLIEAREAHATRDLAAATALYREVVALDASRADALYRLGNVQKDQGCLADALKSYNAAIEKDHSSMQAYCNRGVVCHRLGDLASAQENFKRAIELDPRDAISHYNMALLQQDRAEWNAALASYDRAIHFDPSFADAQYNRALLLLSQGDFARGWQAYEWRWQVADRLSIGVRRHLSRPTWLGDQPVEGRRLLLTCEAGLGDTIQFSRYAALCADRGATVLLEVQSPLVPLLGSLTGVASVLAIGEALPGFDLHCPLMSLPLAFGTLLKDVPSSMGYLSPPKTLASQWQARLGRKVRPRIGLAWSGNPKNWIDSRRSIKLREWLPFLPSACDYYCLQTEISAEDSEVLAASSIARFEDGELDFPNTAALCRCLDLVITVDTSVAHLSGALGQPTWLLLPSPADWRWLHDRADSPWYSSVKLYRQSSRALWPEVLERVSRDLVSQIVAR